MKNSQCESYFSELIKTYEYVNLCIVFYFPSEFEQELF